MVKLLKQIIVHLKGESFRLLVLAGVLLLIWGTLSPVGTLVWWSSHSAETLGLKRSQPQALPTRTLPIADRRAAVDCYIVFLPGVGDFSADQLTAGEDFFLTQLARQHPNCAVVGNIFPYSAANQDLAGKRLLAPFWRAIADANGWLKQADVLIKIRNLWRFAISADERYGPVYNQGIASAILNRMNAAYPIPRDRQRPLNLVLIGTSGGVQVALGAATYLHQWLSTRLILVSVGGVFDGGQGFDVVDRVYHFSGQRDWIEDIGRIVFPSRWWWTVGSPFNRARQQGRYTTRTIGPQAHDGEEGYFGTSIAPSGVTYVELTLQQVDQLPIWSGAS